MLLRSFILRCSLPQHHKLHRVLLIRSLRVWEIKNDSSHTEYTDEINGQKGWRKMEPKWQLKIVKPSILSHFLPYGYPDSVSTSYLSFITYSFIASVSSATSMVLSTQALLLAIGVGSNHAPPIAGAFNWILKDGIGQIGGVYFASKVSSSSLTIDSDPKRWRILSALALDGATMLETLCPLFPHYFLPLASIANIGKNIGFLTASASRASIHQALVKRDNLGDITAKAGSQSTAASLVGTSIGIILSPLLGNDTIHISLLVFTLSSIHIFYTCRSLRFVTLTTLNRSRLDLLLQEYFKNSTQIGTDHNQIRPESISQVESLWPFSFYYKDWLKVGCSLSELCPDGIEQLTFLRDLLGADEKYIICPSWNHDTGIYSTGSTCVKLTFFEDATRRDILRGMTHAYALRVCITNHPRHHNKRCYESEIITQSYNVMKMHFDKLILTLANHGWNVEGSQCRVMEGAAAVRLRIDTKYEG